MDKHELHTAIEELHEKYQPLTDGHVATHIPELGKAYSGEWAYWVGVPAKSGVSGGVFSPRLDARGNSSRGIEVCSELVARFGLHAFDCLNAGSRYLDGVL